MTTLSLSGICAHNYWDGSWQLQVAVVHAHTCTHTSTTNGVRSSYVCIYNSNFNVRRYRYGNYVHNKCYSYYSRLMHSIVG